MHKIPLLRAEVAVREPGCPEGFKHGACIVYDVGPRLRCFPHIDVRRLQGDEVVEFVAVNQIHPGQHTHGPIDSGIAIVAECPKSVIVHVQGNFNTVRIGVFTGQRTLHSFHTIDPAVLVLNGASEGVGAGTLGNIEEHIIPYKSLALQIKHLWGQFPLVAIKYHGGKHSVSMH